jgi:hypothetical protein
MIRKGLIVIVLIAVCGLIGSSVTVAQPSLYSFTLSASVGYEGKVELKWSRLPGDSVRYYLVYRASLPNALTFSRIDSTTSTSKVDMPPASSVPPVYLYYVEAKMKGGSTLRSNTVTVLFYVVPKIDVVRITSEPVKMGKTGVLYTYQVRALSSDSTAKFKYELSSRPSGMAIDSTGLIKWMPEKKGIFSVFVTVFSSKGGKASQQFYVTVTGPTGTIAGVVKDTTGKPIPKVTIRLYGQNTIDHFEYNATTDTLGKYSIAKIDFGTYLVRAVPMKGDYLEQWYDGATTTAGAKPVSVKDTVLVTVNFKLKSKVVIPIFTVSGTVTDNLKKPLKNAVVAFTVSSFGFNSSRPTDDDWSGDGDNRDLFDLGQVWAMVLGAPNGMLGSSVAGMGSDGFSDFRLDGNSTYVMKAKVDSLGRYSLKLPQGSYIAQAEASGYYRMFYNNRSDLLSADIIKLTANTENINFALKPILPVAYGKITGSVVDSVSRGGVVSRIIGYRFLVNGKDTLITPRAYVTDTDSVGVYTLANLPPGDYIVLALPLGHYVPSYYSVSGPTKEWRKATKVNVNGTTVTGITIYVVPMLKSATGYSAIRGSVLSATRPGSLGKLSEALGVEGSLVYAVESTTGQVAGYGVTNTDGSFTIAELAPGTYMVTVDKLDYSAASASASPTYDSVTGAAVTSTVAPLVIDAVVTAIESNPVVPVEFGLEQNYPNPFNPSTQILFSMPQAGKVSLTIYNLLGQKIMTLVDGTLAAGTHTVSWNGRDARGVQLPSGVYFYSLKTSNFTATKRMILMK